MDASERNAEHEVSRLREHLAAASHAAMKWKGKYLDLYAKVKEEQGAGALSLRPSPRALRGIPQRLCDLPVHERAGVRVYVLQGFRSENEQPAALLEGMVGSVVECDDDGDALVDFGGLIAQQWVAKDDCACLLALAGRPARATGHVQARGQNLQSDGRGGGGEGDNPHEDQPSDSERPIKTPRRGLGSYLSSVEESHNRGMLDWNKSSLSATGSNLRRHSLPALSLQPVAAQVQRASLAAVLPKSTPARGSQSWWGVEGAPDLLTPRADFDRTESAETASFVT
jgi:hypothetical protein